MTVEDGCFTCSGALLPFVQEGDMIFTEEDEPTKVSHILPEGGDRLRFLRRQQENYRKLHRYGRGVRDILLFLGKEKYGICAGYFCDTKVIALPRVHVWDMRERMTITII